MLTTANPIPTMNIAVPKTKTCGGIPTRVAPYTHTGNGGFDPLTKFEVTKSSMDSAKDMRAPASTPGMMSGKVINRNVVSGRAPKS